MDIPWADHTISLFSAAVLALLAVALNSYLHDRQLRKTKRVDFLIQAYREIEAGSNWPNIPNKTAFERAGADIFLMGSPKQISLAEELMNSLGSNSGADTTELLQQLRHDLRIELGLERVGKKFRFLRLARHQWEVDELYRGSTKGRERDEE